MALDVDLVRLGLELEHTKCWCRLGKLLGSLVGRNRVVAWVELEISMEIRVHPMKDERVLERQPPHLRVPF